MSDPTDSGGPSGDDEVEDLGIPGIEDAVEIGLGGFGRVYRASQPAFGRTVAVKVLAVGKLDDKSQQRFERECQAMGALSGHPNIVTVFDAGTTAEGRPYLIMEYMSGGSFDDKIRGGTPMAWEEAAEVGAKVAAALQVAHDAGIIHRDIKPANVLISRFGEPQLGDFGIARITGGSETKSGVITASMAHAAPEVLDGARPTAAADIYAVGSMVYEMVAGSPAFFSETDETNLAMIRRIYDDPVPDLRAEGVPEPIVRVVERSMAKRPEDRQATAAELAEQLRGALREAGDAKAADAAEAAAATGAAAAAAAGLAPGDPGATTTVPAGAGAPAAPPPGAPTGPPSGPAGAPVPGAATGPSPVVGHGQAATGPVSPPPGMPAGAQPFTTGPVPPTTGPVPAGGPKRGGGAKVALLVGGLALVVLLVAGAAAFVVFRGDDGDGPGPGPTVTQQADPDIPPLPAADPPGAFSSSSFDALAESCEGGDLAACDQLWRTTPVDSDEEAYGATCGGRNDDELNGSCSREYEWALPSAQPPGDLGDDSTLDQLVDACEDGDLRACDDLFLDSEIDSTYEAYGRTCGGRLPSAAVSVVSGGRCELDYGNATP